MQLNAEQHSPQAAVCNRG